MPDLFHLIYTSKSSLKWNNLELETLAKQSRFNNFISQISGLLLYGEQQFTAVLEGNSEQIEQTFEKIRLDNRHYSICLLQRKPISTRAFLNWNIGLVLSGTHSDIEEKLKNQNLSGLNYKSFTQYCAVSILKAFSTEKFLSQIER